MDPVPGSFYVIRGAHGLPVCSSSEEKTASSDPGNTVGKTPCSERAKDDLMCIENSYYCAVF